jgi:hypothetical protein
MIDFGCVTNLFTFLLLLNKTFDVNIYLGTFIDDCSLVTLLNEVHYSLCLIGPNFSKLYKYNSCSFPNLVVLILDGPNQVFLEITKILVKN